MPDPPLEIRAARRSDLEEILRLLARDSFTAQPDGANLATHYIQAFDAIAASPDNELVVATPGLTYRGGCCTSDD